MRSTRQKPFLLMMVGVFSFVSVSFADISDNMKFELIPNGTFKMGSPTSEANRRTNEVEHEVVLTEDFEIMTTEVTQEQWFNQMKNNPSYFKEEKYCPGEGEYDELNKLCKNHPVENVSLDDIELLIAKLNERNDGYHYRLPTEAEWEYAARGGAKTAYSFGDDPSLLDEYGWFSGNSQDETHKVSSLKPNSYGLYDMHGNVWEWVGDWYGDYPQSTVVDPKGPSSGLDRVIRGGGWSHLARNCRSAFRNYFGPHDHYFNVGFRLLRVRTHTKK